MLKLLARFAGEVIKLMVVDQMSSKKASQRATVLVLVKALHARRRELGLCIYDPRELGRPEHGPIFKAGRCEPCYAKTRESNIRRRREGRS